MFQCQTVLVPSTSAWEINSFGAWSSRKLSNPKQLVWLIGGKSFNPVMTVVVWQGAVLDNYCRLLQRFEQEWEDCVQNKVTYWWLGNGLRVLLKDFVLCHFSRLRTAAGYLFEGCSVVFVLFPLRFWDITQSKSFPPLLFHIKNMFLLKTDYKFNVDLPILFFTTQRKWDSRQFYSSVFVKNK